MKKYLGDILLEKGYISSQDLNRALSYQMRKVLGDDLKHDWATGFLLDIARTKYNNRDEFYLGKILTEMRLLPETRVQEALEIQKAASTEKPKSKLDALSRVLARMNSTYNLIDLLNQVLVLAAQLVEAESASLIIYDHAKDALVILVPTGPGAEAVRDQEIPMDTGIAGWVYRNSVSVISNDTSSDTRFYAAIDAASGYTSRQILCVPLNVKDRRLGALEAINKTGSATGGRGAHSSEKGRTGFSQADQLLLEMFSAQAAIAIESTRLTVSLSRLEEDLALQRTEVARERQAHVAALVADSFLHEMRKSMIPLQGYGARLREVSEDERVRKYSDYIDQQMGRLITHAEDVGSFLKDEYSLSRESLSLRSVLGDLESEIWVDCRTCAIVFEARVDKDVTIHADRRLLLKALRLMFCNSRDAMPEGGTFSVGVSRSGPHVLISASDTGTGIEEDNLERVFEPFFTSGKRHSAGLGLSIARRIVEMHDGSIHAANRADAPGAVLTVTLPVG
jgi:signal transduction histidine kinase